VAGTRDWLRVARYSCRAPHRCSDAVCCACLFGRRSSTQRCPSYLPKASSVRPHVKPTTTTNNLGDLPMLQMSTAGGGGGARDDVDHHIGDGLSASSSLRSISEVGGHSPTSSPPKSLPISFNGAGEQELGLLGVGDHDEVGDAGGGLLQDEMQYCAENPVELHGQSSVLKPFHLAAIRSALQSRCQHDDWHLLYNLQVCMYCMSARRPRVSRSRHSSTRSRPRVPWDLQSSAAAAAATAAADAGCATTLPHFDLRRNMAQA
jgi:hypothetical protein